MSSPSPIGRRTALAALTASVLAVPVAAEAAPEADSPDHERLRGRGGRHGHGHGHDHGGGHGTHPVGPLSPPDGPFTPDCPRGVSCDVRPAAYESTGEDPQDYANFTLGGRTARDITSIVVHDTEETYEGTIRIFQDPASQTSIHYVIREDGHITQMVRVQDMAWHAGNWTFNQSSIGIEIIGYAEKAESFTAAQYEATGKLIAHLCRRYDIPRDREHVVAHEDIPGSSATSQAAMHWDPGAYFDWAALLQGAGIRVPRATTGRLREVATIAPSLRSNTLALTSCTEDGGALPAHGASAVPVRTAPRDDAPLLVDPALAADDTPNGGSDRICDWGAQLAHGQSFAIAQQQHDWVGLWIGGEIGWVRRTDAGGRATIAQGPRRVRRVAPRGSAPVRPTGSAYPAQSAFEEAGLEPSSTDPLPYELAPGQSYVVEDEVRGSYYWAPDVDGTGGMWVRDDTRWLRVSINHRFGFVRESEIRDV
ncbi:N-acetylmuramoyl-L-alanine amidase [Brachybacterium sp. ACRRE]|uniref:N-acetylmuramoyl-L-alanine amidase n=1 Tax=Brachybacterium sp. ACRRE TaxID=2918184 RepID=UPI001EF2EB0A|nr:peptidoglycan recognition family protein [Brachybacterium sp. ACRRE]MCG7310089.1 N-acetylmuramoyl-L-alanine amidase [Brachybacterium sp. ACRRE]